MELMLNATLKKLNETLNDIDELETEQQTLQDRLTDVRQSMRRQSVSVHYRIRSVLNNRASQQS